jgi:hypothetical protein
MKNKLIKSLVAGVLLTATGLASAEPLALTDSEMDNVSAGLVIGVPQLGTVVNGVVGGVLPLVNGVVGTVDGLLPSVTLQLGGTATVQAGLAISL